MKIKLNEALKSYSDFLNERELSADVETIAVETPDAESSRSAMLADVDTIITSLETLASSVTEMLEEMKNFDNEVNEEIEAVNEGPISWVKAKMLQGKQKKITSMKLKSSDLGTAAAGLQGAENRDKKTYLADKKKQLDDNIKSIQSMVDDRAKEIGSPAPKIISREKIAGQMEVIKSQIGEVENPSKKKDMTARLGDLKAKHKEETEAIAQLKDDADVNAQDTDGDDKTVALKDELAQLREKKKSIDTSTIKGKLEDVKLALQIALLSAKIAVEDGDPKTDPKDSDEQIAKLKDKQAKLEDESENGNEDVDAQISDLQDARKPLIDAKDAETDELKVAEIRVKIEEINVKIADLKGEGQEEAKTALTTAKEKLAKAQGGEPNEGDPVDKNSKEGQLKRLEDAMAKAKESGNQDKIDKVQALIDKVSAKESWQLEGTELGRLLEMEITKIESEYILNESRYFDNSIKDAFRRLL